jgi:putative hydrolase of the HAD superfamily
MLSVIGFDADDTLWHNETLFRLTEQRFAELLADFATHETLSERLLETERRNLRVYGYGVKGFTLSMIETALELTQGRAPSSVIEQILAAGREMMTHPVELLPGAREALETLAEADRRLVLITKGDLFHQEQKVAQSGLGDLFQAVEIVSEKEPGTYARIFTRHGEGPERAMMVGNSVKSDIIPAIEAGAFSAYVPYHTTWALEMADEPVESPRFAKLQTLAELPGLIERIESA